MYILSEDTETVEKINKIVDNMAMEFRAIVNECFEEFEKEKTNGK